MTVFHGLSAFPLTPADAHGHVQTDALAVFVERIQQAGAQSVGLLGSTGSAAYLSRAERRRAIAAAAECLGGRTPLIAGISALRTDEAQALAQDAAQAGADALLMAPVSYTPITQAEAFEHYRAVSEATDLPLCIYNNPTTTHFTFSLELIAQLAALPNIKAIKMPLPPDDDFSSELARLRVQTPDGFAIGYSGDWGAAEALLAGCDAWYSVAAGLLPEPALKLTRAAQQGDKAQLAQIEQAFAPLWSLFKALGSYRVMYMMADILGLYQGEPPRPILPLSADLRPQVAAALEKLA